jgi:gephyrin
MSTVTLYKVLSPPISHVNQCNDPVCIVPYKKGIFKVLTPTTLALGLAVPSDSVYRINTGAPLPLGTNAVIMVEDTRVDSQFAANEGEEGEEKTVELLAEVDQGENVRKEGSDVRTGDKVLSAGDIITELGGEVGTLAFVGRKQASALCTRFIT